METLPEPMGCSVCYSINRPDGVVAKACALQSVSLGLISLVESYQKTLKMVSTVSLLVARQLRDVEENKPVNSLGVS